MCASVCAHVYERTPQADIVEEEGKLAPGSDPNSILAARKVARPFKEADTLYVTVTVSELLQNRVVAGQWVEGDVVGLRITVYDPETSQRAQRDIPTTTASLVQVRAHASVGAAGADGRLVSMHCVFVGRGSLRLLSVLFVCFGWVLAVSCSFPPSSVLVCVDSPLSFAQQLVGDRVDLLLESRRMELARFIVNNRLVLGPADAMRSVRFPETTAAHVPFQCRSRVLHTPCL